MTSLGVEGVAELEPELGPTSGIRRRRHRLGEVVGGRGPAERGFGRAELGEHLGTELGARRLRERSLEVTDCGLGGTCLARGGAQLLDDPLVPAGVAEQQVRGDPLDVGALGVHQPSGVEVAAARSNSGTSCSIACCTSGWTNRSGSRASTISTPASASAAGGGVVDREPASAAARRSGTSSPRIAIARASAAAAGPSRPTRTRNERVTASGASARARR